jgi:polysaccharide biosynthesis/export protein
MRYFPVVIIALIVTLIATSCTSVKNFQYLQGTIDTARLSKVQLPEALIQKGDLLNITVYSDDPLATAAVTRQASSAASSSLVISTESSSNISPSSAAAGYLVDQKGDLELYKMEPLHVEGLTKYQLADTLEYFYTKLGLLKNPYVEVRFLNYKITVIGEVNTPGPITVPTDKLTAFEAIGLAGEITISGRRDNVLVVREVNGVRTFGYLNLQDPNVFLSPYYYLKQNDLVVVDVGKLKSAVNNQNNMQYISYATSLLSIVAVFISIFRR